MKNAKIDIPIWFRAGVIGLAVGLILMGLVLDNRGSACFKGLNHPYVINSIEFK